jgi:membrane-bound metal-dependent hydrolase YbcI (DUF457 family)
VWRPRAKAAAVLASVLLANVPDFPLPYWGHHRYDISHSIFVNAAFILLISLLLLRWPRFRRLDRAVWILFAAAAAWLSHLLLDTFYNHGQGLGMFWPFSKARIALAIPWFESLQKSLPYFDSRSARIMLIELLCYGLLFAATLAVRLAYVRHRNRG